MKKPLILLFLLSFHLVSFAPALQNNLQEEIRQNNIINRIKIENIRLQPNGSPLDSLSRILINSPFGDRTHPVLHEKRHHDGIDIEAKIGSKIRVTAEGIVEKIEYSNKGYGNYILVAHVNGYQTRYAHLNTINVVEGQHVKRHMVIGTSGNTGMTTGPHLHYEILKDRIAINPISSLTGTI